MEIKLKHLKEESEEAALLSLAVRMYDYYSDPVDEVPYWESMRRNALTIRKRFEGTPLQNVATTVLVGIMSALEEKLKAGGGKT